MYNTQARCLSAIAMYCVLILFSTGCKKEAEDGSSPEIIFNRPHTGDQFFFQDAIPVKANVTDDKNLESIRIQITNAQNQVFLQSILYKNEGTSKSIETAIFVDDIYLESGTYFVKITANDGINESVAFQEIQIYGQPRTLEKVYVVRQLNTTNMTLDTVNQNGYQIVMSMFLKYAGGALDSRNKVMMILNKYDNSIFLFDAFDFGALVSFNTFISDENYFQSSTYDEKTFEFFAGTSDGLLYKMDENGSVVNAIQNVTNDNIIYVQVTENYIYTLTESFIGERNMNVYYRHGGTLYHSTTVNFEVTGIVKLQDENHILIAGNESTSTFKIYNNETNALNSVFNFYDLENVYSIWPGSEGEFYAYHQDGLVCYHNNLENFTTGLNITPIKLKFEPLTQRVYVVAADGLHVLNANCDVEIAFYPSSVVKDILFLYNK